MAQRIDESLQTDGFFERLWRKLIKEQRFAEYFAHAAELERLASGATSTTATGPLRPTTPAKA
ncbi:hypothetical protein SAM23877_2564 [Streptomyces ambofaciens ATCC 23877]|uniref:Uncharacterized protein n=1 Tax=Streptomyces ambofaciens (strain ATCC 23877 / 3486 / DSM 40053 / JCM 4204 / NBRC 12836 / NRRL B-2516) TaxID=278992 RepID=A0A0K2ARJ2_STRA7|nr:hypothetical protein SAM23877_2564 [Streptomyces ambofaciens ATCC 23877]